MSNFAGDFGPGLNERSNQGERLGHLVQDSRLQAQEPHRLPETRKTGIHMRGSIDGGTPKWMVYMEKTSING